jgi:hypothetical protein
VELQPADRDLDLDHATWPRCAEPLSNRRRPVFKHGIELIGVVQSLCRATGGEHRLLHVP